jgi:hypothetical protein
VHSQSLLNFISLLDLLDYHIIPVAVPHSGMRRQKRALRRNSHSMKLVWSILVCLPAIDLYCLERIDYTDGC